ncbi:TIR domain-containing protein [Cladochytrium replicatum]|nr:TIR domain-containing protein [Cladochytrium replicatum]
MSISGNFDVMLSYCWADKEQVIRLRDKLRAKGIRVWIDIDHMAGDTTEAMPFAVLDCTLFVPCLSQPYANSQNAMQEFRYAYKKNKRRAPVVMQDGWASVSKELEFLMGTTLYQSCVNDSDAEYDAAVEYIKKQLDRHRSAPTSQDVANPAPHVSTAIGSGKLNVILDLFFFYLSSRCNFLSE